MARIGTDTADFAHPYDGNLCNKLIKVIIAQLGVVIALSRVVIALDKLGYECFLNTMILKSSNFFVINATPI